MNLIDLNDLSKRIYDKMTKDLNARQTSIILRVDFLLFTDLEKVWEYDFKEHCFHIVDLQEMIQYYLNAKPISHSFTKAVMDYLPLISAKEINDYDKEKDSFVNQKIIYNNNFNEELKYNYEIKYIESEELI